MAILEYEPGAAFSAVIGRTAEESAPAWPARSGPANRRTLRCAVAGNSRAMKGAQP
jgi:hypothetical protein